MWLWPQVSQGLCEVSGKILNQPKRESPVNYCNIDFLFDPVFRGFNKTLTDAQAMKIIFIN